jgi:predicted SprT family Zn-dependent metalloprotease
MTLEQYGSYQATWAYFNKVLFNNILQPCMLTFSRQSKTKGFFAPDRWRHVEGEKGHEIALNPDVLTRPLVETMSTLVHEMVHQWQQEHGHPSRRGYHNAEWADMMQALGLMPSDTGDPSGRRTGQRCSHYIVEGGLFLQAFEAMPEEYLIPWRSGVTPTDRAKRNNKTKYQCPSCSVNVWGKPSLNVVCGDCNEKFVELSENGEVTQ